MSLYEKMKSPPSRPSMICVMGMLRAFRLGDGLPFLWASKVAVLSAA